MNNLEYLNEISKSNRPEKAPVKSTTSLIIKIAIGGVIAFLALALVGKALGGGSVKSSTLVKQLYLDTTNLNTTVTKYNKSLKSSNLRAASISLSSALTNASNQLSGYFTASAIDPAPDETMLADTTVRQTELDNTLNNAKLNGILDRIYASQIQLQLSLLLSLINQNIERADNAQLLSILQSYQSTIALIQDSFSTQDTK